jgi:type II secretory pathway pseudopilin PulG
MRRKYQNKRAFTLVEAVIAVAVFSAAVITVSSLFSFIRRTFKGVDAQTASVAEIERFLLVFNKEVGQALELVKPSFDSSSNVLRFYSGDGKEVGYEFTESGTLVRTDFVKKTSRTIMRGITDGHFSRFTQGLVQVLVCTDSISVINSVHVWNAP